MKGIELDWIRNEEIAARKHGLMDADIMVVADGASGALVNAM